MTSVGVNEVVGPGAPAARVPFSAARREPRPTSFPMLQKILKRLWNEAFGGPRSAASQRPALHPPAESFRPELFELHGLGMKMIWLILSLFQFTPSLAFSIWVEETFMPCFLKARATPASVSPLLMV